MSPLSRLQLSRRNSSRRRRRATATIVETKTATTTNINSIALIKIPPLHHHHQQHHYPPLCVSQIKSATITQVKIIEFIDYLAMTAKIRSLVSKKKKRYKEDGFNLDLTYIYDNIIAMGFPADKLEGVYRNPIDEVVRFLDSKHYNHYRIYNLCSERHYDSSKFHNRVAEYPFDDHCPPTLELLRAFCEDVDSWLAQDKRNVAAIHCKAGKGRTGVMICAYMLHKGLVADSTSALNYYGEKRTHDNRGVTIPSQKRYVDYYHELVKFNLNYRPIGIILCSIHLEPTPPNFINTHFVIYHLDQHNRCRQVEYFFEEPLYVHGDIKIEFYQQKSKISKKEKLFSFWFNTFFAVGNNHHNHHHNNNNNNNNNHHHNHHVDNQRRYGMDMTSNDLKLVFYKEHLDKAYKDTTNKLFGEDFKVILKFKRAPPHSVL